MSSKSPVRSCEDVDETALSYAEIKALCAGNPLIAEKMNLDVEVAKLRMLKADHQSQHFRLEDDLLKRYPEQITSVTERIGGIEKDIAVYTEHSAKTMSLQTGLGGSVSATAVFAGMTVNGILYSEKEPSAKALLEACKGAIDKTDKPVGEYMGFKMSIQFDSFSRQFNLHLRGSMTYQTELGTDAFGNITRINNTLNDLPKRLDNAKAQLETLYSQQEAARQELEKPFALVEELADKEARLALLNADLNIDGNGGFDVTNDPDESKERTEPIDEESDLEEECYYEPEDNISCGKSKPSLIDDIRSFNSEKSQNVTVKKVSGIEL